MNYSILHNNKTNLNLNKYEIISLNFDKLNIEENNINKNIYLRTFFNDNYKLNYIFTRENEWIILNEISKDNIDLIIYYLINMFSVYNNKQKTYLLNKNEYIVYTKNGGIFLINLIKQIIVIFIPNYFLDNEYLINKIYLKNNCLVNILHYHKKITYLNLNYSKEFIKEGIIYNYILGELKRCFELIYLKNKIYYSSKFNYWEFENYNKIGMKFVYNSKLFIFVYI